MTPPRKGNFYVSFRRQPALPRANFFKLFFSEKPSALARLRAAPKDLPRRQAPDFNNARSYGERKK
jgi:hypothetical protein